MSTPLHVCLGLCALLVTSQHAASQVAPPAFPAPSADAAASSSTAADARAAARAASIEALGQAWRWRQIKRDGLAGTFGFVGSLPGDRLVAADAEGLWIHDGHRWTKLCGVDSGMQHQILAVEELPWGLVVVSHAMVSAILREPQAEGDGSRPAPARPLAPEVGPAGHTAPFQRLADPGASPFAGPVRLLGRDPVAPVEAGPPARLDDDTLVVPVGGALYAVEPRGLVAYPGPPLEPGEQALAVAAADGLLVVQSDQRTWTRRAAGWRAQPLPDQALLPNPRSAVATDGAVVVLDQFPCYWPGARVDPDGVSLLPMVPDNGQLAATAASPDGQLLLASRSGRLHALAPGGWREVTAPAGVAGQLVSLTWSPEDRVALVDGTGVLWSADLSSQYWTHAATEPAMGPAVNALAPARAGGVWLAGQGLARYAGGEFVERIGPADVPGADLSAVTCVLDDDDGTLWIGSGGVLGGVLRRERGVWIHDRDPAGPGEQGVHSIQRAPDGALWCALLSRDQRDWDSGGVAIHDDAGWRRLPEPPGGMHRAYAVRWSPDGRAFVGTDHGVQVWDGASWRLLDDGTPASDSKAFALHLDRKGRVWTAAGTYLRGVQSWDPATRRWTVRSRGQWRIAAAGSFAEDRRGRLWMASEAGLFVAQGEDCFRISTDGVADTSVFWPLLADDDGRRLWIGSLNGALLRLDLHDDAPPRTIIADVSPRDDLPEQVLVARWSGADTWHATRDEHMRFQWRLDDEPWQPVQRERHARFSGLGWGEHRLEVRAIDLAGNVEDPPAAQVFRVPRPAWLGPWALIPASALVASLVVLLVTTARRRADRRAAERRHAQLGRRLSLLTRRLQDAQEAERRWLSRDLQERLGQALAATTLQLELAGRSDDPQRRAEALERGTRTVREVLDAVRALASDVAPPLLNDFGLEAAVLDLARAFETRTGVSPELRLSLRQPVDERVAGQVHRILEQALDNVARHAHARRVSLDLGSTPEAVHAIVRDDGVGFVPHELPTDQGLGLLDIRERAESLGGHVMVDSAYHGGTTVRMTIPLDSFAPSPGRFPPWLRSASSSPTTTAWSSTDSPPSSKNTPTST